MVVHDKVQNFDIGYGSTGRSAIASRDLERGDVALSCVALVPPVLMVERWMDKCAACLGRMPPEGTGGGAGKCSRCKFVRYCSKQCQLIDFKRAHKHECRSLGHVLDVVADHSQGVTNCLEQILLLGRVIRAGKTVMCEVDSMSIHTEDADAARESMRVAEHTVRIFDLVKYVEGDKDGGSTGDTGDTTIINASADADADADADATDVESTLIAHATLIAQRFKYNNFLVLDELCVGIAAGVFPVGAILNHSCRPNCVISFSFDKATGTTCQVIRVIAESVAMGKELTHAYIDPVRSRARRQAELLSTYRFSCTCSLCVSIDAATKLMDAEKEAMEAREDAGEGRQSAAAILTKFARMDDDQRRRPQNLMLCSHALTAALDRGNWVEAAVASAAMIDIYEKIYATEFHPLIGLQCYTLKDCLEQVFTEQQARKKNTACLDNMTNDSTAMALRAYKILRFTHGPDSELCRMLQQSLCIAG